MNARSGRGVGLVDPGGGDERDEGEDRLLAERGEAGEGEPEREADAPAREPQRRRHADRRDRRGQLGARGHGQRTDGAATHQEVQPAQRQRAAEPRLGHRQRAREGERAGRDVQCLAGAELVRGGRGQRRGEQQRGEPAVSAHEGGGGAREAADDEQPSDRLDQHHVLSKQDRALAANEPLYGLSISNSSVTTA